jgi:DUF1365 family protein
LGDGGVSASALYVGKLAHARRAPPARAFEHALYMLYLDLDELERLDLAPALAVEAPGLLSFRRRDYRGPVERKLKDCVLDDVAAVLGERPRGPVRLLTHVRSFGRAFNPVSFYYCFAEDGTTLCAVLAEITNTPWGERHAYVVAAHEREARGEFAKAFHVSPFLPMTARYRWHLPAPGAALSVEMRNEEHGAESFRARLSLERRALTRRSLVGVALAQPFMSLRVLAWIYGHALVLFCRGAKVFPHPKHGALPGSERREA